MALDPAFPADFQGVATRLGLAPGIDPARALARPLTLWGRELPNRICALPMEGWDADREGMPGRLTTMRWERYGWSGAALIWGEAMAVSPEARAHYEQLVLSEKALPAIAELVTKARASGLPNLVGVQLNHAGRFAKPKPLPVYHDPALDARTRIEATTPILTDDALWRIIDQFVDGAELAQRAGFDFVDIKLCHRYLGHELLCARQRAGAFGGSLENRSRFFFEILKGIRARLREMPLATRLSLFEPALTPASGDEVALPFGAAEDKPGEPDLAEPLALIEKIVAAGVNLIGTTLGSPYTSAYLVRPAGGLAPGEKPAPEGVIAGVARHLEMAAMVKAAVPKAVVVVPGLTALGEVAPAVAAAVIETGAVDMIGLGRGLLACPDWPARVLAGDPPRGKEICATCARCTAMARRDRPAGCYLRDSVYKNLTDQ